MQFLNYGYTEYIKKTLELLNINVDDLDKNSTGLGPARLSRYLKLDEGISIPPGTVVILSGGIRKRLTTTPMPWQLKVKLTFYTKPWGISTITTM